MPRRRRTPQPSWPCSSGRFTAECTSGMRASNGLDHVGASTSISESGKRALSVMNRLWAMTMSPTQAGPTTSIRLEPAISLLVQPGHIFFDALLHSHEGVIAAGGAELRQIRFGEALVTALEHVREGDVLDLA